LIYRRGVRVTRDVQEWLTAPEGACMLGTTWALWCHSPTLVGSIHWGRPEASELEPLAAALEFICHPRLAGGADVLMDNSRVERLDADALLAFGLRIRDRLPEWGRRIRRHAVILPEGLAGVLVAGLLPSLEPPYPFRFVHDPAAAAEFLQRPEALSALAEAEEHARLARGRAVLIDRLRAQLAPSLAHPNLDALAAALGYSGRSLQRALQQLETSFSDEVRRARVAAAVELLRATDSKIEAIALRVGFSSASRMSAAFRAELGLTPSQVRDQRES
jgi:AraC-like DNA-binding protein